MLIPRMKIPYLTIVASLLLIALSGSWILFGAAQTSAQTTAQTTAPT